MTSQKHDRQYDIVVFGASGYTGQLTAEYITNYLPSTLTWAVAGRTESKLKCVVDECRRINSDRVAPEIEIATLNDDELKSLAKKTFILISTVGPYASYGEYALKACAEAGTHYFDVTGEVPWVAKMIRKYEGVAKATGAMMFPQVGIESAPPDLLTWSLADMIRKETTSHTGAVTLSLHQLDSMPSGGTLATALGITDHFSLWEIRDAMKPYATSPIPNHSGKAQREPLMAKLFGARRVPELGILTTSVAGSTDAATVHRSWGLLASTTSREKQFYGPNFSFNELYRVNSWFMGVLVHFGLLLVGVIIATPLKHVAKLFVYAPGQGPDREAGKRDVIEWRAIARPDNEEVASQVAFSRARFNGSMYYLSALISSQAALTLLEEEVIDLPGGILTAACLGQPLIDRLDKAGLHFETKFLK